MSLLLGLWTAALVLALPLFGREASQRVKELVVEEERQSPERVGPLTRVGSTLITKIRARVPNSNSYLANVSPAMVVATGVCVVAIALIAPAMGLTLLLAAIAYLPLRKRSREKQRSRAIERQLSMVIDLYRVAINAGLNITLATEAVAKRTDGPLGEELKAAVHQIEMGERVSEVLLAIPERTTESVRTLIDALVSSERYGSPLSTALERVSLESRVEQERAADKNAKRLSLLVVLPLAGTTLPAFLLLVAVPFFASSVGSLASQLS